MQRAGLSLLQEDQPPAVEAHRREVTVVVAVEETAAGALPRGAGEVVQLLVAVQMDPVCRAVQLGAGTELR